MSLINTLFSWIKSSGVLEAAQKQAAAEVANLIHQAAVKAAQHAPDMREQIEKEGAAMLKTAVFGIATKAK